MEYYKLATELDSSMANYKLGKCYYYGNGTKSDRRIKVICVQFQLDIINVA